MVPSSSSGTLASSTTLVSSRACSVLSTTYSVLVWCEYVRVVSRDEGRGTPSDMPAQYSSTKWAGSE